MIARLLAQIGRPVLAVLAAFGRVTLFAVDTLRHLITPPFYGREFAIALLQIGWFSLPVVGLTAFFTGGALALQIYSGGARFSAEAVVPQIVAIGMARELGPVLGGLMVAARVASSIAAEIGTMKVTEQIDAMEVSGTNPFKYLVVTRVLAATLMLPILVLLGDSVSLYGAWIGVNIRGNTSFYLFWTQVFNNITFSDVLPAFIKSYFFGFAVGIIGSYKGFNSNKGTEGVGRSANSAVVVSSVVIFIIDLLAVQVTDVLGLN